MKAAELRDLGADELARVGLYGNEVVVAGDVEPVQLRRRR